MVERSEYTLFSPFISIDIPLFWHTPAIHSLIVKNIRYSVKLMRGIENTKAIITIPNKPIVDLIALKLSCIVRYDSVIVYPNIGTKLDTRYFPALSPNPSAVLPRVAWSPTTPVNTVNIRPNIVVNMRLKELKMSGISGFMAWVMQRTTVQIKIGFSMNVANKVAASQVYRSIAL